MTQQEQAEEPSSSSADFVVADDDASTNDLTCITPFLRPATARDEAPIEALIFSILKSYGLSEDMTDDDLHAIEEHYKDGMFDVLVDNSNGKKVIVGTVALHRTTPELCELRKMYLSPTHRGNGLGRLLMKHALDRAKELGYKQMWLESSKQLKEARNMYESYGFVVWESPPKKSDFCDYAMIRDL
jgi:putative acetyltransferase